MSNKTKKWYDANRYSKVICTLTIISPEPYAIQGGSFSGADIEDLARFADDYMHIEEISKEEISEDEAEKERTRLENK